MRFTVTDADTAMALGSGDVPVLATPRVIAWLEAATVEAAQDFLTSGETSVGSAIRIEHQRATSIGDTVEVSAFARSVAAGRRLTFEVVAVDSGGHVVATGEIDRVVVDRRRFLDNGH
jgi:predicted thioesterase